MGGALQAVVKSGGKKKQQEAPAFPPSFSSFPWFRVQCSPGGKLSLDRGRWLMETPDAEAEWEEEMLTASECTPKKGQSRARRSRDAESSRDRAAASASPEGEE